MSRKKFLGARSASALRWLYAAALLYLTLMMVIRRLAWGQVPGQIPGFVVWTTIGVNLALLGIWAGSRVQRKTVS